MKQNNNELYHSYTYLGADYTDGIRHYKYVSKIPIGNGKYRYIYDIKDKYNNSAGRYEKIGGKKKSKYGTYTRTDKDGNDYTYEVKKSKNLFSSKSGYRIQLNQGPTSHHTTHEVGRLRQNYDYTKGKIEKALNKLKSKKVKNKKKKKKKK